MPDYINHYSGLKARRTYDASTALSLAILCYLAYKKPDQIKAQTHTMRFDACECIDVRKGRDIDTQAFVARNPEDIVIAFRGSESINDWFSNFQAVRDPGPLENTKAHEGFQDALFPAVIRITNCIDTLRDNQQRIWMTGHSLGGALCSLYAAMLFEAGYTVYGIYTFASPRPGDDPLASALDTKMRDISKGPHHRVMNEGDIVPHLPPEPFFSHSGKRMILKNNSEATSKSSWKNLKRRVFNQLMDMTGRPWDIKDNHLLDGPDGYLERLLRQANRTA